MNRTGQENLVLFVRLTTHSPNIPTYAHISGKTNPPRRFLLQNYTLLLDSP